MSTNSTDIERHTGLHRGLKNRHTAWHSMEVPPKYLLVWVNREHLSMGLCFLRPYLNCGRSQFSCPRKSFLVPHLRSHDRGCF